VGIRPPSRALLRAACPAAAPPRNFRPTLAGRAGSREPWRQRWAVPVLARAAVAAGRWTPLAFRGEFGLLALPLGVALGGLQTLVIGAGAAPAALGGSTCARTQVRAWSRPGGWLGSTGAPPQRGPRPSLRPRPRLAPRRSSMSGDVRSLSSHRPVLKHGPRSLTRARVDGGSDPRRRSKSEGPSSRGADR
jgi:hypothetical protein